MTLRYKIYIGLAVSAIFAVGIIGGAAWTDHKIAQLERSIDKAKREADISRQMADSKEIEAAGYKQKIEYLGSQIGEIQKLARKQDEEMERLSVNSGRARGDVERARRVRSISATTEHLCAKLAELGHGCH